MVAVKYFNISQAEVAFRIKEMKQNIFFLVVLFYFRLPSPQNAMKISPRNQEDLSLRKTKPMVEEKTTQPTTEAIGSQNFIHDLTIFTTQQPLTQERKELLLNFFSAMKNKFGQ